jgi:hypothetical protein
MMTADTGDLQVKNLNFSVDGTINGAISVATNCSTCGVSRSEFDVEVDVEVPQAHRGADHELEIGFEPVGGAGASVQAGFPVKMSCSCGRLEAKGVVILRRGN